MASRTRLAVFWKSGITVLILSILFVPTLRAQSNANDEPIHTLHVYMELIQVPVLVLDREMRRMKPIDASRFLISLDSGPVFHPRNVRPEGDDPISLAILLDANAEPALMAKMSEAIASLVPEYLHPQDRIALYGLDCVLTRTLLDIPANPSLLKEGVDRTLADWAQRHQTRHAPRCPSKIQLWDAMGYLVQQLSARPGRRVMLVVSDGDDHGSRNQWNDVCIFAQESSVAIFGYSRPIIRNSASRIGTVSTNNSPSRSSGVIPIFGAATLSEDHFNTICQSSGGVILSADGSVAKDLAHFTALVRERYIVEFARARNDTPGQHSIFVAIDKSPTAYVRSVGVIITMRDAAIEADPSTIPRDATNAPELGKRKPIR